MPLQRGRFYLLRVADHYSASTADEPEPAIVFVSGLYENDIEHNDIVWMVLTNWWSSNDMVNDVREAGYVLKDAIIEYWDVTPGKPGINPRTEEAMEGEDEYFLPVQGIEHLHAAQSTPEPDTAIPYVI